MNYLLKITLTWQIILSMVLGIICGIFFGEMTRYLSLIGQAFIMMMEMPVLLFLFSSIVIGISQLTFRNAKKIFLYSLLFLSGSWIITQITIFVLPLGFPPIKVANKYATISNMNPIKSSLLDYFIPQNPFKSFAEGTLPAIVIFSIFFAMALLHIKNKQGFLKNFRVIQEISLKMFNWINNFSPIGVFALTASAAGVRTLLDLQQIQYYYYSFIFSSIFVSLIALPLFTTVFLPFSYKDIIKPIIPSLLIAFVTSNVIITLPFIINAIDKKMLEFGFVKNQSYGLSNTLVPLSYNFPISGKLINLIFIMFVAWHYNINLTSAQSLQLSLLGVLTSFGSSSSAISFLLDALELPSDALELFISSALITSRFSAVATIASITTLCFFSISSFEKRLLFSYKKFLVALLVCLMGYGSWFLIINYFKKPIISFKNDFSSLSIANKIEYKIINLNTAYNYKNKDFLLVGFMDNNPPFSYFNSKNDLVGLDIQAAHDLAKDLKLKLLFVKLNKEDITYAINNNLINLVMSGVILDNNLIKNNIISNSYLESSVGLLSLDKNELETLDDVYENEVTIGVIKNVIASDISMYFANRNLVEFNNYEDFLNQNTTQILIAPLINIINISLKNPLYSTIKDNLLPKIDYIYLLNNKSNLKNFINNWIELKKSQNYYNYLYDKWVINKTKETHKKRWSIWQNIIMSL